MFINGEWCEASTGNSFDVVDPATGAVIGSMPDGTTADAERAIGAADAAFAEWSATTARERSDMLLRAWQIMTERAGELAELMTREQGKPLKAARNEVNYAADFLRYYSEEATRVAGEWLPSQRADQRFLILRQPVGVVAMVTPWNYPISMLTRKMGPALAAGCTLVLKPAEDTPLCAKAVFDVFIEAGIPAGVINMVTGKDPKPIGEVFTSDPRVRKITFTGSTPVGRMLAGQAAANLKRVSVELGGHAPVIVCEDTDVDAAAVSSAIRAMRNAGQVCTSPTRFFVHEQVYERFLDGITARSAATVVGDGFADGVEMGPLANGRRLAAMQELVDDAAAAGATVTTGGRRIGDVGYFFEPTVLADVPDHARIMQEEPFGPVAIVNPVSDLDEAIDRANSVPYGLAAYGFTNRADYVDEMVERVEAGNLSINTLEASLPETPFGGMKSSGYGREGGTEGLHHYMVVKNVSHSIEIV